MYPCAWIQRIYRWSTLHGVWFLGTKRGGRGGGRGVPPLLCLAATIFQKFTYRKLNYEGVAPHPHPILWEHIKNCSEIIKMNITPKIAIKRYYAASLPPLPPPPPPFVLLKIKNEIWLVVLPQTEILKSRNININYTLYLVFIRPVFGIWYTMMFCWPIVPRKILYYL